VRVSETVGCRREGLCKPCTSRGRGSEGKKAKAEDEEGERQMKKEGSEEQRRKRTTVRVQFATVVSSCNIDVLTLESTRDLHVVRRPDHVGAGKSACVEKRERSGLATCKRVRLHRRAQGREGAGSREEKSVEGTKKRTRKEKQLLPLGMIRAPRFSLVHQATS
jgi:hypothetical protein